MLACETWLANDFLTRRGYKPGPCCGHDPDACPPHRAERERQARASPRCPTCTHPTTSTYHRRVCATDPTGAP